MTNNPTPEDHANAVREELFAGRKIQAIKVYRLQVPCSLADAKEAVEKLEADLRGSSPERFKSPPAGKGCFAAALVLASATAGAARLLC